MYMNISVRTEYTLHYIFNLNVPTYESLFCEKFLVMLMRWLMDIKRGGYI
jgi:hypothetical protein